jgi:O-antigen ligase
MKSILSTPLSSETLWEISYLVIGTYLLWHPVLGYPQSLAVALGGGLLLFLFRPLSSDSLQTLGKTGFLFLAFLLASTIWSLSPGVTLQSTGLVYLGVILYLMARGNALMGQGRIETVGLLLAVLAAFMALYQWFFGFENLSQFLPQVAGQEQDILKAAIHNKRASGPLVTSGALAALLLLFIPLGFTLSKINSGFKRWFFGFLTLLLMAGLLATQSVGAFFSLTLSVLFVLLKRDSKKKTAMVMALGVIGVGILVLARGPHSWFLAAFQMRLALWKSAWTLFLNHPLLGTGLGTFGEAYQEAGMPLGTGALYTHNLILQVLAETGLVGLLLFLATLFSLAHRLRTPFRWEGWGAGTGVLAFLLFSLVDLPFQMPELVWFFALLAGRLELRLEKKTQIHRQDAETPRKTFFDFDSESFKHFIEWGLLIVFLITGFWPPFRPWNFCLLAGTLWILFAMFQQKYDQVPLWMAVGALFLAVRAFFSPSALGTVWFLEILGLLLVFFLVLPCLPKPRFFLKIFLCLGLAWALKAWWASFHYSAPGFNNWLHFQYSDVKDWVIFPNPKQVAIVMGLLILILPQKPWNLSKGLLLSAAFLTIVRLRAFTGLAALFAGLAVRLFFFLKSRFRFWIVAGAVGFLILGGVFLRSLDPSSTKWERFGIWNSALKVWERSPLLGVGPGAFAGYFHQVPFPKTSGVNRLLMDPQYAHNEFLDFLAAFGLVGLLFGGLFLRKAWRRVDNPVHQSAIGALGAASFFDFCLHTPLIALQGVGLLADSKTRKPSISHEAGFLALGLAAGLFASPVFSGVLKEQYEACRAQNRGPEALRCLETAERLNAWDARLAKQKAGFLEELFLDTKDPVWERKSDEATERVLDLEKADGQGWLEKAEKLTARLAIVSAPEDVQKAEAAWDDARQSLPYNAFVDFEYGFFLIGRNDKDRALWEFQKAVEKEPNFAEAWVNAGLLLKEKGDQRQSRECFQTALGVYNQWKDADRIDPLEKQLVSLPPVTLEFLRKETVP